MLDNLRKEDLQLKNRWYCQFDDFTKSSFLVKSVNIPFEKLIVESDKYGNKFYSGFTPVETITITFYENTSLEVYQFFEKWMNSIFDPIEKVFKVLTDESVKYKNGSINLYTNNKDGVGDATVIYQMDTYVFQFKDLMILGIDEISLDQTEGTPLEWTATFAVRTTNRKA